MIAVVLMAFSLFLCSFVGCFGYQYVPEVCVNRTTIERIAGNDPHTFDAGTGRNIAQVFGEHCIFWFLPIPPERYGFNADDLEEEMLANRQRIGSSTENFLIQRAPVSFVREGEKDVVRNREAPNNV
jgi:hypothetical protein